MTGSSHTGLENPADPNSKALESVFENLTTYKNRNGGIWGRGEMHLFKNVKFADNAMGFTHAAGAWSATNTTSQVVDSLFVGETENIGNPTTDAEKAYGRSLPKPTMPDFPIRGYEYYDYRHDVVNTTFRNYEDNATRKTGAISYLLYTSFGASSNNAIEKREVRQRQAGVFPADGAQVGQRQCCRQRGLQDRRVQGPGRLARPWPQFLRRHPRRRQRQHRCRHGSLRDQAHLERCGVQGRCRAHELRQWPWPWLWRESARGAAPAADLPPVKLSRKGKEISIAVGTNVRADTEFKATTERTSMDLHVLELDAGKWVIVEIPGFTKAASGAPQDSLDALRKASVTSYYKGAGCAVGEARLPG